MKLKYLSLGVFLLFLCALALPPAQAVEINGRCYNQPISVGVNEEGGSDAALVQAANLGWIRITIAWRDVSPVQGTWNWGATDGQVNAALARGIKVLAILSTAPTWAGSNSNGTLAPGNIALWEEFVREAAKRYNGKIKAYEIWNEPNLENSGVGVGWAGSLWTFPTYADYVRAASKQIRAWAPGTLVVGPVTSSEPNSRTVEVFRTLEEIQFPEGNASVFMDVVSFHANGRDDESTSSVLSNIRSHLSTLGNRNPSNTNKPIWITEFGWKSNQVTENGQRDRIRNIVESMTQNSDAFWNQFPCGARIKYTHAFIYKEIDSATSSQGIYRQNSTAKPVVTGYLQTIAPGGIHPNTDYAPMTVNCVGRTCTFSSGFPDPGDGSRLFDWDFGDGATGFGQTVVHTYASGGQFFVFHGTTNGFPGGDARLIQVP